MARLLFIEDDPWFGELYVDLLEREYDVVWLQDAYDAIDNIGQNRPDIILLDIMLPWANGIQLLHELVGYRDTVTIPVVLFSAALPDNLSPEIVQAYGVVAALDKSRAKPKQVLQTIRNVLRSHANNSH